MGFFDRFKGRPDSEDALAQARADASMPAPAPQSPPPGDPSLGVPLSAYGTPTDGTQLPAGQQNVQIPGVGDLGALMAMIQQAQAQGNLHVDTQNLQMGMQGMPGQQGTPMMGMPMLDLRSDPDRRKVVFDILKKHGYDPHEGQAIQVTDPAIQAEIMQAIQQHAAGQPPPQLPGSDPGVPGSDPNATPGT